MWEIAFPHWLQLSTFLPCAPTYAMQSAFSPVYLFSKTISLCLHTASQSPILLFSFEGLESEDNSGTLLSEGIERGSTSSGARKGID